MKLARWLIDSAIYYKRFFMLVIHAGTVWNIKPEPDAENVKGQLQDWRDQVRSSPLRYELEALEAERARLTSVWANR